MAEFSFLGELSL